MGEAQRVAGVLLLEQGQLGAGGLTRRGLLRPFDAALGERHGLGVLDAPGTLGDGHDAEVRAPPARSLMASAIAATLYGISGMRITSAPPASPRPAPASPRRGP